MAWAPSFGRPQLQVKEAMVERASTLQLGQYGQPYIANWDTQRAVTDGYDRVMWVFRCIDAIASNAAMLPMVIRKGDADRGDLFQNHPVLPMLNDRANMWETSDVFWYRLFSQYLLSKKGVFVEIRYNRSGDPGEMYLLPPQWTFPIPDKDSFVSGYRVQVPGAQSFTDIPATDFKTGLPKVVWIRKPHPLDPYSGVTPLESAGLSIDTDYYARLYNRSFLQNDGRPGGVLAVKGSIDPQDAEELRRRFNQGPSKAGSTAVLEADDLQWIDVSTSPRDAQYVESRRITKEEIMLAFGVPESILGNASGRTYDNADAEKFVFWQETMQFHLRLVAGFFDFLSDDTLKTAFDTSGVGVLRRNREQEEAHDMQLVRGGLMTINEWRDKHGWELFNTPAGRALWVSNGLTPQPAEGDEDAFPAVPAGGDSGVPGLDDGQSQDALPGPPDLPALPGDEAAEPADPAVVKRLVAANEAEAKALVAALLAEGFEEQ